jgi:hypothetical protein
MEQLLEPLRTDPPTIGSYPRELDLELFRLPARGTTLLAPD